MPDGTAVKRLSRAAARFVRLADFYHNDSLNAYQGVGGQGGGRGQGPAGQEAAAEEIC